MSPVRSEPEAEDEAAGASLRQTAVAVQRPVRGSGGGLPAGEPFALLRR